MRNQCLFDPATKAAKREKMLNPSGYELIIPQASTIMALGASDRLVPIFDAMSWTLVEAQHAFFVTSDNPIERWVDPATRHPIYGDHGFRNKNAEVTFPLSPKLLLLMSWKSNVREFAALGRDHLHDMNGRQLGPHLRDKRVEDLARVFKNSRPAMTTEGYGPKTFAPIGVERRSKTKSATRSTKG